MTTAADSNPLVTESLQAVTSYLTASQQTQFQEASNGANKVDLCLRIFDCIVCCPCKSIFCFFSYLNQCEEPVKDYDGIEKYTLLCCRK